MRESKSSAAMVTTCSVEGCDRTDVVPSRGWCRKHYQRWRLHGDPTLALRDRDHAPKCSVEGCDGDGRRRGLCNRHYKQFHPPDPNRPITDKVRASRDAYFWTNTDKESDAPCWRWLRPLSPKGYGQMRGYRSPISAHRFAYELVIGPIPDGLTIDHLCRNTWCVNPEHLEPVTLAENLARSDRSRPNNGGRRR